MDLFQLLCCSRTFPTPDLPNPRFIKKVASSSPSVRPTKDCQPHVECYIFNYRPPLESVPTPDPASICSNPSAAPEHSQPPIYQKSSSPFLRPKLGLEQVEAGYGVGDRRERWVAVENLALNVGLAVFFVGHTEGRGLGMFWNSRRVGTDRCHIWGWDRLERWVVVEDMAPNVGLSVSFMSHTGEGWQIFVKVGVGREQDQIGGWECFGTAEELGQIDVGSGVGTDSSGGRWLKEELGQIDVGSGVGTDSSGGRWLKIWHSTWGYAERNTIKNEI
ncbi:hypothetical protein QE152_g27307 [Popillia japonica]|uniref:Uncharacterized protein n=1 Tax=Popillia japonica TaxID=7064 RepID=A0AAW1JVC0_POPJA